MSDQSQRAGLGSVPGAGRGSLYETMEYGVCVTHMIFYPFDRMYIYVPIFQSFCQGHFKSPHLYLTFKSSHVGMSESKVGKACWDKSLQTFLPRWFPYISDFIVSQDPLT